VARYPRAEWRPVSGNATEPPTRMTQVILHVAVSEARSLWGWFDSGSGGIESHLYVRRDGTSEQYVDTEKSADANYTANRRPDGTGAISVETQGMADGEWTPEQLATLLDICWWAHETHGIPLRRCPGPDSSGIGWHTMWGAPGPWTPVAKTCPGPDRIRQVERILLPTLTADQPTEEDPMPEARDVWDVPLAVTVGGQTREERASRYLVWTDQRVRRALAELAAQRKTLDTLASLLAKGDAVTAEKLRTVLREELATAVIDVEVSVRDKETS
jgi:hypothetical protein